MFDDRAFSGNGGANYVRAQAGRFSYAYFAAEKHCRTSISES